MRILSLPPGMNLSAIAPRTIGNHLTNTLSEPIRSKLQQLSVWSELRTEPFLMTLKHTAIKDKTPDLGIIFWILFYVIHIQFSSVAQSCPNLCDPMNCSMPGLPVHHHLPEFTQTHFHRVSDAIQPSVVPFSSCPQSLPASESFPMSQLFTEVAKVLEFQL